MAIRGWVSLGIAVAGLVLPSLGAAGQFQTAGRSDSETLAVIQGGGRVRPEMVRRFEVALTTLDTHCSESRTSRARIASLSDMAVTGTEIIKKKGKRVALVDFTEAWAEAVRAFPANGSRSCSDVAAALMVLLTR